MKLVIVESPTKARKLSGYLDKNYTIEASVGHIRDLPKSGLGVDVEHDFEPVYEVNEDKKDVVRKLTKLAKQADHIILATDPDREGEAIAWHLQHILTDKDSKTGKVTKDFQRATFHEITKQAVLDAVSRPQKIKSDLVDAQQARRVVDRLVGYKLSPVLWKKIRRGLSAGRVQSVALRMIVEREREIEKFIPDEYWELDVALSVDAELKRSSLKDIFVENKPVDNLPESVLVSRVSAIGKKTYKPKTQVDVEPVIADLKHASTKYTIGSVEKKERKRSSLPPFTTSTLQQTAATRLGFTSKQTMRLAQQLYEEGLITYHRTDSVALSAQSLEMARGYIGGRFGESYLPEKPRYFANNSKNAQEAHEAIRATSIKADPNEIKKESSKFTERHVRLYDLIQRRFVASQMATAMYDQTSIEINAKPDYDQKNNADYKLKTTGSVLKFEGWMALFPSSGDTILPDVAKDQELGYLDLNAAQKFTQPPARYNDASLVKELEKRGIGRPSTYASIISVLEDRGYVERDAKRFVATMIGMTVSDFLLQHFPTVMDYDFTAEMEEDLDRIARGEKEWKKIVKAFYSPFEKTILKVEKSADRAQIPVEKTGETCPECKEGEIVIRTGRFGKFKSCSRFPECKFTENIVDKVEGVTCPLCHKGDVISRKTRWGKLFFGCERYPDCDWASWSQPKLGDTITAAEWAEMQKKREERKKKRAATKADKKPKSKKTTTKKATKKTKKGAKKS